MINDPELLQAIENVFNERFESDMEEFRSTPPHVFSEKHNKKMAKLIKRQRKPYFKLICTTGRRVACIVVLMLVVFASSLTVKAVREAVYDFIMSIFSDHTVVTVDSGTDAGYPETIEEEYYISDLPEGFDEVEYMKSDLAVRRNYFNNNSYIFFLQFTKAYYRDNYDNEHSVSIEHYRDNKQEYQVIVAQNVITYIWDNGRYIISITSNLDKNSILKLCKSTKFK